MRFVKLVGLALVLSVVPFAASLLPRVAEASENQIAFPAPPNDGGIGTRTFGPVGQNNLNITMQCLNVDVYVRAGCDAGCVVDAGPGDIIVSFTASADSYPFPLDPNARQDRIHFKNVDGGAATCFFFNVLPQQ